VEPPQEHLLYGTAVHLAAEEYVRDGTPIPAKYGFIQEQLDKLVAIEGTKYCEYEMGLTREFEPCGFNDKEAWWRGIADLIIINGDRAYLVDYKTSKTDININTIRHGFNLLKRSKELAYVRKKVILEKAHSDLDNDFFDFY
jgi:hypothetical protein